MRILLARHGETAWNAEGRYQGQEDTPLSETGEKQARRLGERLRDVRIDRAVCSPLTRTYDTAQFALGEVRATMLMIDNDLMEIAHGRWEGKLASEIEAEDSERFRAWRETPDKVKMPDGESLKQVLDRAWPALARACDGMAGDETLLVVSHDAVNRALICRILGLPLFKFWTFRQAPATLNLLEGPDVDRLEVVRLNDCSHHTLFFGESVHRAL